MPTYRHKNIRRFRLGPFQFKDHLLVIKSAKEDAEFLRLLEGVHRRYKAGLVEINEQALANLERPVGQRTIRGPQQSRHVPAASQAGHRAGREPVDPDGFEPTKSIVPDDIKLKIDSADVTQLDAAAQGGPASESLAGTDVVIEDDSKTAEPESAENKTTDPAQQSQHPATTEPATTQPAAPAKTKAPAVNIQAQAKK